MPYMLRFIGARSGYIINLVSLYTVDTSDRYYLYFTFMWDLPSLDTGLLILTPSFIQRLLWRGEERIGSADKGRGRIVPEVWVISSSSHCFHTQKQIYKTDTKNTNTITDTNANTNTGQGWMVSNVLSYQFLLIRCNREAICGRHK